MGRMHKSCIRKSKKDKGELTRVVTHHPNNELKDHQIRELVNELRDIAVQYHGTQQLREKIARAVNNSIRSESM